MTANQLDTTKVLLCQLLSPLSLYCTNIHKYWNQSHSHHKPWWLVVSQKHRVNFYRTGVLKLLFAKVDMEPQLVHLLVHPGGIKWHNGFLKNSKDVHLVKTGKLTLLLPFVQSRTTGYVIPLMSLTLNTVTTKGFKLVNLIAWISMHGYKIGICYDSCPSHSDESVWTV